MTSGLCRRIKLMYLLILVRSGAVSLMLPSAFSNEFHPDNGPIEVIVAVQLLVLLHLRLAVRRAGQIPKERPQPAADVAPAVTAAGGKPRGLYDLPHIGVIGDGQAEEVGILHVIGP